ncbi:hypothetical protein NDU88_005631 [Pleurodeles waltl]|uniref:Uncharacterized protein n=1 Tax=Pleurodeles waltl TaxID=8319 RepID=A0AAV7MDF3_PLEWA|nr:hypothetical protein NDU88_005631 [Pleurodeles waltl]
MRRRPSGEPREQGWVIACPTQGGGRHGAPQSHRLSSSRSNPPEEPHRDPACPAWGAGARGQGATSNDNSNLRPLGRWADGQAFDPEVNK